MVQQLTLCLGTCHSSGWFLTVIHVIKRKLQLKNLNDLSDLGHRSRRWPSHSLRFWLPTTSSFLKSPWHPKCLPLTVRRGLGNTKESKHCQQFLPALETILPSMEGGSSKGKNVRFGINLEGKVMP